MFKSNVRITRTAIAFALAAGIAMSGAIPAFADDGTSATVTAGALTITNPTAADFVGKDVTGVDQTTTAALNTFSVSDLTGSGAGWNVTAQASQFTGTSHNLAVGSLKLSAPTVAADGTTSAVPSITGGPYTIDSGSAVKIASAGTDKAWANSISPPRP